jgi:hypothetical protein
MIFFQATPEEERNAHAQFAAIESLDPPGEFAQARDKDALVASLVDAMRPRVQTFKRTGDRLERVVGEDRRGLPVMLEGSNLRDWSRPLPPGPYTLRAVTADGKARLERGDRLLLELARDGQKVEFRPHLYVPDAIPLDGRKLLTKSADGQKIHAGLGNCKLVPRDDGAGYDLEMLVLLERERRPEELQVTYPQFVWVEPGTQNEGAEPPMITRLDNELYFPSPAYKIRVAKWPPLPGQQNVRQSPSRPALTIWSRNSLPGEPFLFRRDTRLSLAENFEGKTFAKDGKQVKIDSVRFDGEYLYVQISHPPGPPVVFMRTEELKDDPRLNLKEEHRFYAKAGKYTARFGPLTEDEQKRGFTLAFYSMNEMKHDASKIELRPNVAPDVSDLLGQDTPAAVRMEK